jgi:hypothetical protein
VGRLVNDIADQMERLPPSSRAPVTTSVIFSTEIPPTSSSSAPSTVAGQARAVTNSTAAQNCRILGGRLIPIPVISQAQVPVSRVPAQILGGRLIPIPVTSQVQIPVSSVPAPSYQALGARPKERRSPPSSVAPPVSTPSMGDISRRLLGRSGRGIRGIPTNGDILFGSHSSGPTLPFLPPEEEVVTSASQTASISAPLPPLIKIVSTVASTNPFLQQPVPVTTVASTNPFLQSPVPVSSSSQDVPLLELSLSSTPIMSTNPFLQVVSTPISTVSGVMPASEVSPVASVPPTVSVVASSLPAVPVISSYSSVSCE